MINRKINILFIHPYKHSVGPNVVLLNLVKWLDRSKFNLYAVFPLRSDLTEKIKNSQVEIFILPQVAIIPRNYNPFTVFIYFIKQLKIFFVFKRLIKEHQIDIIHISTTAYWPAGLIAKLCKIKNVFHAQDLTSMRPKFVGLISAFFLNLFTDKIICVSKAVSNAWQKAGVSSKKLTVIYNGIDLEKFKPLPQNDYEYLKNELNLKDKYPLIGMIAGMDPRKGHKYFIYAANQIKKSFPKAGFLIAGSLNFPEHQRYFENLELLVKEFDLEKSLFFLDERKDIPQIINLCDLMIVPSETEAGPFVVLEIQACAKSLIASNVGGIPEYLENGKSGFLVPVGDSKQIAEIAIDLLNNPSELKNAGLAGLKFVQKFRIQEKIKAIENLYLKLLNQ
ncbi:MAG: glycosyltransferase family 4 protein [Minisyncoccia bacterium]